MYLYIYVLVIKSLDYLRNPVTKFLLKDDKLRVKRFLVLLKKKQISFFHINPLKSLTFYIGYTVTGSVKESERSRTKLFEIHVLTSLKHSKLKQSHIKQKPTVTHI